MKKLLRNFSVVSLLSMYTLNMDVSLGKVLYIPTVEQAQRRAEKINKTLEDRVLGYDIGRDDFVENNKSPIWKKIILYVFGGYAVACPAFTAGLCSSLGDTSEEKIKYACLGATAGVPTCMVGLYMFSRLIREIPDLINLYALNTLFERKVGAAYAKENENQKMTGVFPV